MKGFKLRKAVALLTTKVLILSSFAMPAVVLANSADE